MKHFLHLTASMILILPALRSQSQITQLSGNTNINYGIALGSIGVLADKNGSLWKTDGTSGGTVKYTFKVLVDSNASQVVFNNKIYFAGISTSGKELWVTDGTDGGTNLVKDIVPGSDSSSPTGLTVFNNALYFFATTAASGTELWKSDGTDEGTAIVKDINPGTASSYDEANTSFFASNGILYFNAYNSTSGTELWKTDGTSAGTVMIKDINPGADSSNCGDFTTLGTNVIFTADDGTHGTEIWKTNGTEAGTSIVADIVQGSDGSYPNQLVPFNNKVFFEIIDAAFPFGAYHLYYTDGNTATPVKDFGVGSFAILFNAVIINNKLIFAATSSNGTELWTSDGTEAGTYMLKDISPGFPSGLPIIVPDYFGTINGGDIHTKLFNGKIFFVASDGTHGTELWITDGTSSGTVMVKDINPGDKSSLSNDVPSSWYYTVNTFFFVADNGTTGKELFKTDGTEANTVQVADINPGSASSNPFLFMFLNKHLYFTADNGDGDGAKDLYLINEEVVLPLTLLDFTAMLNGKAVDLNWTTSTETNTKNFVIQRSSDAIHFDNIGSMAAAAAGNSTTKRNYNFIDAGAFNAGVKVLYYRLQVADNDGKLSNSKIAKVEVAANGNVIAVYPNPVKDKLVVLAYRSLGNAIIKITDQTGKIVLIQKISTMQAGEKHTLNVAAFGSGTYYLQLITDNNKQKIPFIKY